MNGATDSDTHTQRKHTVARPTAGRGSAKQTPTEDEGTRSLVVGGATNANINSEKAQSHDL